MKKILMVLLAVMMLVGVMSLSASAALVYNAVYGVPEIDGIVSAGEWDDAVAAEMNICTNPGKQLASHPTMKIMHDGTYMYVLIEATDAPDEIVNTVVCVHIPHDGCELDGCKSYIKFVVDGKSVAANKKDPTWIYQKDEDWDGKTDFEDPNGGKANLVEVAYNFLNGRFTAELKISVNYGNAIPEGEAYVDVRADFDNVWATHQWAYQERTWDPTFNPAWDAGTLNFLAEGEEAPEPVETEPVETEPVETEPVETEPVETEPVETEPVKTEPKETEKADAPKDTEKADDTEKNNDVEEPAVEKGGFPIVPVIAVAAVIVIAVVLFFVFKKRK